MQNLLDYQNADISAKNARQVNNPYTNYTDREVYKDVPLRGNRKNKFNSTQGKND